MSLLESYKQSGLLFNSNFLAPTSQSDTFGYRGELVLVEGEVADSKGHVKPPLEVMRGAILLASKKLELVIGALDDIESINTFIEKYQADFSENMITLLYVVNIEKSVQVDINGIKFVLIPLLQGVPWNEVIDELALEKSDFKGQSPANKILTLFEEMKNYNPKYPQIELDEIISEATDVVREAWGAV